MNARILPFQRPRVTRARRRDALQLAVRRIAEGYGLSPYQSGELVRHALRLLDTGRSAAHALGQARVRACQLINHGGSAA